ncbi:hypothetical protein GCM10011402_03200 [Paracoccus acridae]|jgi:hypothetical protein|uniref:Uncharacterized protein n=1 Tax=Paracoccus acridae TaxID=1795310 RepID=A0ABQ1VCH5_9RHOB|nr:MULTISPECIES: hypothetical protein [Paracoccus]GGF54587.1 hypothetical protein GCM10011402_03200 [Paracoccus acridae]
MKKLALTTLTACLLAAPALAAPTLAPEAAAPGTTILANCPGKPPVNA